MYAEAVQRVSGEIPNCVGFIDGTNIHVARPGGNGMESVTYSDHKRKHSLKFQGVNTPDELFNHVT